MTDASVTIEVSPGELLDKLTILEIKRERITDPEKLDHVETEYETLRLTAETKLAMSKSLSRLKADLRGINERLWEIEDAIRDCERAGDFGPGFIELARLVYRTNDRRAAVKSEIDAHLGARFSEQKSYAAY